MKAAIIEKPGELTVRDIPLPETGPYDALCELLYGATCTGTDQHLINGWFPWTTVIYPTVLGHESIGRVVAVGEKVRHLHVGDLVTRVGTRPVDGVSISWGGFAEYGVAVDHWAMAQDRLPREAWAAARVNQILPPGTDPGAATMMTTWRETLSYVTRMGIGSGAKVLVLGSGGNGLSFVTHAANLGADVTLVGSAGRRETGLAAGACTFIDYRANDVADQLAAVSEARGTRKTGPTGGFDFAIDAVGQSGQIDLALPYVAPGGTVGIYGMDDFGRYRVDPQRARGTVTFYNGGYDEAETHQRVLEFWWQGKLRPELWFDLARPYPLAEINRAFAEVRERKLVKALIKLHE
jgi:2-desacetyl-2-hydroxyethyl bacteriochlorophyllide A dehydrogenase